MKPDGVILSHSYDVRGRLIEMTASDRTISYRYTYDKNDNVLSVVDTLTNATTTCSYDLWNRLLTETLANGLSLAYRYDNLGCLTQVTLPDRSYVLYTYDSIHLATISRYNADHTQLYQHSYSQYDLNDQFREVQLIGSAGKAELAWTS